MNAEQSTLFAEDSHAKTSALPARAKVSQEAGPASGSRCSGSSTRRGRGLSSPRTSPPFALADWTKCSGRSLRSGMTRNGIVFPLPPLALLTAGTGCGSWPTPKATPGGPDFAKLDRSSTGISLETAVRMYPTPTAIDRPNEGNVRLLRAKVLAGELTEREAEQMLGKSVWESQGKVPAMFPTPTVQDASNNASPSQFSRNSLPLNAVAGGALNPTWVEWLMGFPAGWTDSSSSVTPSCRTFLSSSDASS